MKFAKYLFMLAIAFCAFAGITKAQNGTVMFLGGGSSALFQELGSASQAITDANGAVTCLWSQAQTTNPSGTPYIAFHDGRSGVGLDETGKFFVAWNVGSGGTCTAPVAPFSIYAYMQLDSVVGDRCYFISDGAGTGCTLTLSNIAGAAGGNIITTNADNVTSLPSTVYTPLSGAHSFVAGTDIRPEDAKFATQRMFTPCNQIMPRQYFNQDSYYLFGLGYGSGNVGTAIQGSGGPFNVVNFNITGNDPISGSAVPAYSVSTIGAQPIIVAVGPNTDSQVALMKDINAFTLTLFYQGVLGRTTDLLGPTGAAEPFTIYVREPLSGTYNTFEYSIPNGTQYHASQDYGNCDGSGNVLTNPLTLNSGNGVFGTAVQRIRVIGTGTMVNAVNGASNGTPALGYFFWSAGNVKNKSKLKYLTVNGVDPIQNSYSNGLLPGSGASGAPACCTTVTFAGLNAGDYPIWSALRLVGPPGNAGVSNMITALHTIDSSQNDYIPLNTMNIWHSHFFLNGQSIPTPANGPSVGTSTLCTGGAAESGGDAGGANMLIINNAHFCADYSNSQGLLNKTQ